MKRNFILIFATLLCTIAFLEILLRGGAIAKDFFIGKNIAIVSQNPALGYEFQPNFTHGLFRTNSYGFRGNEFTIKKKKNVYRIVIIGDSIPFGADLQENNIFPVLLQKSRQDPFLQGKNLEVVNAGIGGYNIWQYCELYKSKIAQLMPDLVIVSICQNDFEKTGPYHRDMWGIVRGDELTRKSDGSFLDNFYLYKAVSLSLRAITKQEDKLLKEHDIPKLSMKWEDGKKPLLELITQIKNNKTALLFVIFPYQYQLVEKEEQSDKVFSTFMQKNNIHFIDMLPFYQDSSENLYKTNDQIHPNETGHKIVAETIWSYLTGL